MKAVSPSTPIYSLLNNKKRTTIGALFIMENYNSLITRILQFNHPYTTETEPEAEIL